MHDWLGPVAVGAHLRGRSLDVVGGSAEADLAVFEQRPGHAGDPRRAARRRFRGSPAASRSVRIAGTAGGCGRTGSSAAPHRRASALRPVALQARSSRYRSAASRGRRGCRPARLGMARTRRSRRQAGRRSLPRSPRRQARLRARRGCRGCRTAALSANRSPSRRRGRTANTDDLHGIVVLRLCEVCLEGGPRVSGCRVDNRRGTRAGAH